MKILIIEDNRILARNIREYLTLKSFQAEVAFDGIIGKERAIGEHFDVIILDINLPGKDGLTLCRELREEGNNTPVLFLTSRNTPKDVVTGLNIGADDYLGKPFDFEELISRIKALGRRNISNKTTIIHISDLEIDTTKRLVTRNFEIIELSTKEFDLLQYLAQNRGIPVDRQELLEKVWGEFDAYMFSRTVDVHISTLRKKLGKDIVETRKGFGYVVN
ncbi:MAG: two component transcriptional regulator, winged helix family [uncultured bacterium (gcode 4)]|uniref:Two component transcriptional regulator, winged helix family n=1 Tax=uncultured bacterium (gcode 4) TaxID=1234023 RepID=K1YXS5_9BACT|nr:MAG: two component transcriptional regulator, winged helix family [uncultured bacterium (gcode 4)]HBB27280.1 DNA-binding response regulator [Candidatus Gracilibacteria bacterium]